MTQKSTCDLPAAAVLTGHMNQLATTFGAEVDFDRMIRVEREWLLGNMAAYLARHKVIVIRNANLNRAQLHQLGCVMGKPLKYAFSDGVDGYPEMMEVRRSPKQIGALSTMWHSDSTYLAAPPDVTLLYGVEIPPFGGTTLFADTAAALSDLSPKMRELLRALRVVQRSDVHANNERLAHVSKPTASVAALSAVHDAINVSDTIEAIYVNQEHSAHFEGMSHNESKPLIEFLSRHIASDKYRLEISWRPHTLLIADNRKTQHRAIDNYFGHSRTLLRLIVQLPSQKVVDAEHDPALLMAA